MTSLVNEAIDADELKKEFEQTKREVWDEGAKAEIEGVKKELVIDQEDLTIPELDITRSVPSERLSTRARAVDRGDGKVAGEYVPSIKINVTEPEESSQPEPAVAADDGDATKTTA